MNNENQSTTPSISPNEDLANRLKILRAAVLQRINSSVSLIKATAKYVQELNAINDQDIEALQTLDKQISILNGSVKKESGIAGGEIKVPNNEPEAGSNN